MRVRTPSTSPTGPRPHVRLGFRPGPPCGPVRTGVPLGVGRGIGRSVVWSGSLESEGLAWVEVECHGSKDLVYSWVEV